MKWKKSSYSAHNGCCVAVAATRELVLVQDSKDPDGPRLAFTPAEWHLFLRALLPATYDQAG